MAREETQAEREAVKGMDRNRSPWQWRCLGCGKEFPFWRQARRCRERHVLESAISSYDPEDDKYANL